MQVPDGWIEHDGYGCPITNLGTRVETLWSDGLAMEARPAVGFVIGPENWDWQNHMVRPDDRIIAYRPENPDAQ